MYNLPEICVLCLASKDLQSVSTHDESGIAVQDMLKYCLPEICDDLKQSTDVWSEIPQNICCSCRTSVHSFYKFKKTCFEKINHLIQYTKELQKNDTDGQKFADLQLKFSNHELLIKREQNLESELNIKEENEGKDQINTVYIKEEFAASEDSEDRDLYLDVLKQDTDSDDEQDDVSSCKAKTAVNECAICNKKFGYKNNLKRHMRTHAGVRDFTCTICGQKFTQKSSLKVHMKKHAGIRDYECSICNKKFTYRNSFKGHMKIHSGIKEYECKICNNKYVHKGNLYVHMKTHADPSTGLVSKDFECSICNKKFNLKKYLNVHLKTHDDNKDYECSICNRKFKHSNSLNIHMKSHAEVKLYECSICNKKFKRTSNLNVHMQSHPEIRDKTVQTLLKCNTNNTELPTESKLNDKLDA